MRQKLLTIWIGVKILIWSHFYETLVAHLTLNYMMSKDSVQNRMETGISFTEFSYQLIQAYDFYYLYKNKNVSFKLGVQISGEILLLELS